MTVAAVEAAPEIGAAAEGGGAAGASSPRAGNPLRSRGRHAAGRQSAGRQARGPASQSAGGQGSLAPRRTAAQRGGQGSLAPQRASRKGRGSPAGPADDDAQQPGQVQKFARKHAPKLAATAYHRIVIAEFVATVIIIAMAPFLIPRDKSSADPEEEAAAAVRNLKLSRPLVRLTAVCIVFFILALSANGQRSGRVAAAAGALVMLGAMLNATETWAALGQAFAGAQAAVQSGQAAEPGGTVV